MSHTWLHEPGSPALSVQNRKNGWSLGMMLGLIGSSIKFNMWCFTTCAQSSSSARRALVRGSLTCILLHCSVRKLRITACRCWQMHILLFAYAPINCLPHSKRTGQGWGWGGEDWMLDYSQEVGAKFNNTLYSMYFIMHNHNCAVFMWRVCGGFDSIPCPMLD